MLKAKEQTEWTGMYVYHNGPYIDLYDVLAEFLSECEHAGHVPSCPEMSSAVIEDVEAWKKKRKELLVADFAEYLSARP